MTTVQNTRVPEDQPFDHEAIQESTVTRHNSQTKLINHEGSDGSMFPGYDPEHQDTGYNYHQHGGPSEYNLVDKQEAYPGKVQDLGRCCSSSLLFAEGLNTRYRILGPLQCISSYASIREGDTFVPSFWVQSIFSSSAY